MCDCEAGVSKWISQEQAASGMTPDGRPGAVVQFHVPRFVKNREKHLEKVMLARNQPEHPYVPHGLNVLTIWTQSPTSNWVVKLHCLETVINSETNDMERKAG